MSRHPAPHRAPLVRGARAAATVTLVVASGVLAGCGDDVSSANGAGGSSVTTDGAATSRAVSSPVPRPPATSPAPTTTAPRGTARPAQTPLAPRTSTPPPAADPLSIPGPYIAGVEWVDTSYGPSLQVTPTAAGRATDGRADGETAWREVVTASPRADSPGMQAQFLCHWVFARALKPEKPTWNLEPWRPVVGDGQMIAAGCNPGGPEV